MDKHISIFGLFSFDVLPAQLQSVNALFILMLVPVFSYGIYPFVGRFVAVTPRRKIAPGLVVCASSFVLIAWLESPLQAGPGFRLWWQLLTYALPNAHPA